MNRYLLVFLLFSALAFGQTISFAPAHNYYGGVGPIQAYVGDWNGDGKMDIASQAHYGDLNPAYVIAHLGNGDGTFQKYVSTTLDVVAAFHEYSVTAAHLRDGKQTDLLVYSNRWDVGAILQAYISQGNGTFSPGNDLPEGLDQGFPFLIAVGSFGNGHRDIVSLCCNFNPVSCV